MNKQDREITREELKEIEKRINNHTRIWAKILNAGESHGHLKRITNSKIISTIYLIHYNHRLRMCKNNWTCNF